MPKSKYGQNSLLGLVGSDSDDTRVEVVGEMPANAKNTVSTRKTRGRAKSTAKVMKTRSTGRRTSGTKVAPPEKGKRAPLSEKTNEQNAGNDTEKVDELDQADMAMDGIQSGDELGASVVVKPRQPTAKKKNSRKAINSAKNISMHADYSIPDSAPGVTLPEFHVPTGADKLKKGVRQLSLEPNQGEVIPETQASIIEGGQFEGEKVREPTSRPIVHPTTLVSSEFLSRQTRKHARSASDTEGNDPTLRRKLGELTKQLDSLEVKYRDVREIGIKEAERNFERLKKQSEENTKAANALIASLKADLSAQNANIIESEELKKTAETQGTELSRLQAKVAQLTSSLSEAQMENKSLSTRLAANRTVAASVESMNGRAPISAAKPNRGVILMGSAETAQAAQAAQLKEDLYSDLTGLIIRSVKREADEDVYDCIQTGRNGTLHFKLAVANEKIAESYDDAHCIYIPQLDPNRDKALMEVLPEYLAEEITFPRPHAAKFYARVTKALMEKQD